MKRYYSRLSKEEKSNIKKLYYERYDKSEFNIRIIRLRICFILGYFTSLLIISDMFIRNTEKVGNIIIVITLFLASTFFLVGSIKLKLDVLNKIALKK